MLSTSARTHLAALWIAFGLLVAPASAQPVLHSLQPLSAAPGTQVTVTLTGQNLKGAERLWFSLPGVTAVPGEDGRFVVSVAAEVAPQTCDVWCEVNGVLSNPRRFVVTTLPGQLETEDNDSADSALALPLPGAVDARLEARARTDWFRFEGRAGQSLTIRCRSRTLDGDVLPVVTLLAPGGAEIAHSSGRRREPLVNVVLPSDGTYQVRINDRAYRQTTNSTYRLELLTGPRILSVFPDLLSLDKATQVSACGLELDGGESSGLRVAGDRWPLQTRSLEIPGSGQSASGWSAATESFAVEEFRVAPLAFNAVGVRRTPGEVVVEDEPHTQSFADAQPLAIPTLLNGRFAARGDVDWFTFQAAKGETLTIDLYGDRYGRQMDLDAAILDEEGQVLVTFPDLGAPKGLPPELTNASLDVSANWKAPADGNYRLVVRDLYSSSVYGADRTYVLHLRRSAPRARVVILPPAAATKQAASLIPRGGHAALRVAALRVDDLNAPIELGLQDEESGLSAVGLLGLGQSESWLFVSSSNETRPGVHFADVAAACQTSAGAATADVRACTPADNAGVPGRYVSRLPLLVGPPPPLAVELQTNATSVATGSELQLTIRQTRLDGKLKAAATIEFLGLPGGLKAPAVTLEPDSGHVTTRIPIPAAQAAGSTVIAVKVKATVMTPAAPGSEQQPAREVPVEVISNPVTVSIKSTSES